MKKIALAVMATLLGSPAWAADMAVKAPPLTSPIWSWTGFYVGGNVGYSWGRAPTDVAFIQNSTGVTFATVPNTPQLNGALGGVQAGYN